MSLDLALAFLGMGIGARMLVANSQQGSTTQRLSINLD